MDKFNENRLGLTLGTLFAIIHLAWLVVLSLGFAQGLANMWHSMHFLRDMHNIGVFNFSIGIIGIIGAFISGYVLGWLFGALWNWFGQRMK